MRIDVTNQIQCEYNDGESLPITKCVCGSTFPAWTFIISIYEDDNWIHSCPVCGRKLFFRSEIRVYEVQKENKND